MHAPGFHLFEAIVTRLVVERLHRLGDTRAARDEAHEDEAHPFFELELQEPHFGPVEILEAVLRGNVAERAVEAVAEAVIGTDDR